ncbi:MAG: hypothetical protein H0V81_14825 [Solirubrobacterales bacterium]|nr:hypothetical protein [Solirubrobacterales bacterium]
MSVSAVDLLVAIDRLDALVHQARPVPLSTQVRVAPDACPPAVEIARQEVYGRLGLLRTVLPGLVQVLRNARPEVEIGGPAPPTLERLLEQLAGETMRDALLLCRHGELVARLVRPERR